jgi:hypothetical protein
MRLPRTGLADGGGSQYLMLLSVVSLIFDLLVAYGLKEWNDRMFSSYLICNSRIA